MFNITKRKFAGTPADAHRNAFNAAFYELGLSCHWDSSTYSDVLCEAGERECVRRFLQAQQPHLLTAYDAEFLIDAIQAAKTRCYDAMTADGACAGAFINWAEMSQSQVGV